MEDGAEQMSIFSEEVPTPTSVPVPQVEGFETEKVSGYKRKKKRSQEEIIASLPVAVYEHTIPQVEYHCPHCGNEEPECIGNDLVYTKYVRVSAHVDRLDHYVEKYACYTCEDGMEACGQCSNKPRMFVIAGRPLEEYSYALIREAK